MAEPSPDSALIKIIGPLITAAVGGALLWLPGWLSAFEPALKALLTAAGGIAVLAFSLMYRRYVGVLGAGGARKGSPPRDDYDRLWASLSGGNLAARLYADRLTKFLDAIDRFFGDAGLADRTLFPHAFGLRTPAPLWTAPAFDRCMWLALIYPIVTIFIIWVASGNVGPAETALGLRTDLPTWQKGLLVALLAITALAGRNFALNSERSLWKALLWAGVASVASSAAYQSAGPYVILLLGTGVMVAGVIVGSPAFRRRTVRFDNGVRIVTMTIAAIAASIISDPASFSFLYYSVGEAVVGAVVIAFFVTVLLLPEVSLKHLPRAFFCRSTFSA
jgi:hypothetical protein